MDTMDCMAFIDTYHQNGTKSVSRWYYQCAVPYLVGVSFDYNGAATGVQDISREFLEAGLQQATGYGDISITPKGDRIWITLKRTFYSAWMHRHQVEAFLEQTFKILPSGQEFLHLDKVLELDLLSLVREQGGFSQEES